MNYRVIFLALFLIAFPPVTYTQPVTAFEFASRHHRDSLSHQLRQTIAVTLDKPFTDTHTPQWIGSFWAMELMLYQPPGYELLIPDQLTLLSARDTSLQRAFLEMLYALYPCQFTTEVETICDQLSRSRKAIALEYLAQAGIFPIITEQDPFHNTPWYFAYHKRWLQAAAPIPLIDDFLSDDFLPGEAVLCSFQSTNRNQPGYLMIRMGTGDWLRNTHGEPYRFPQLARSISNLPYYLSNGNTPQGLYKVTGFDSSANKWIGPTTNLQLVLPFETSDFCDSDSTISCHYFYNQLLGERLRVFPGLQESFIAGQIGRSEIIAHGTTIDPEYYKGQSYYPNTPSLGCLCSPETWNDQGVRTSSVQAEWINLLRVKKIQSRWLIVAETRSSR